MTEISIIVPTYNEEENIKPFLERTEKVLDKIGKSYEIIFALDPSLDNSENIILEEIKRNKNIKLLKFSRQFGQPAATMAGISNCKGSYCVIIDVDLQDPPEIIENLYNKIISGYEVVYAKRKSRKGETFLKKLISSIAYYLINKFSDIQIPRDTGDYRIFSRRIINHLVKLNEGHGFLRGLVAFVGFNQSFVEYDREKRFAGKGKYNKFFGSLKIGFNGLIGFSSKPLFFMSVSGFLIALFGFLLGFWYVVQKITDVNLTPGLTTTVILISFFAGIQLLGLGLLGEYVGRIYDEVKQRPKYILDKKINFDDEK
ncbi:MAG: glycosyl transferase [Candidatus Pelagibacter sp.]|jgi:dolichol-phosphate mannosyltransferase|nr:glycosyl transferase [Candidatus Pelagibacter sp.]|tara:strand:+ start:2107 stop:3048 length:942 start_codon:yes stop_codon:yes gene_type:complete